MDGNPRNISLEPAAVDFVNATANPPFLNEMTVEDGRKTVDGVQDSEIFKPEVDDEWITVPGGPNGEVKVRIVKPVGTTETLPVSLYTHGAGWVFGDAHTHDRLVRDLAIGSNAAVVFPEYIRAPDAHYPSQNEESYLVAKWVTEHGSEKNLDGSRIAIAGDSVGGNMAIALNLMAKARGDVKFVQAVLFYPVTNAKFDTGSYDEFADGYFLTRDAMKYYWDSYTSSEEERALSTVSPLRASLDELKGFPPTLLINAEADVLRDEGEAFAGRLREAGVLVTQVRYAAVTHDFVMINSLHGTEAAKAAVAQAVSVLKAALYS
jgi:acetyl esterase